MKYIYLLLISIILSLFITFIKSDNDYDNDNQNKHSYHHNHKRNYQSKNVDSKSKQYSYNKGKRNSNGENPERNKKSIHPRDHNYAYRNNQIKSRGNSAKSGSYSESTYFALHTGTDRYGRRKYYSRFQTRGRSNGYRENMFFNIFDVTGNIKMKQNKNQLTKSEKKDSYIKKNYINNKDYNDNKNEKPECPGSSVFKDGYRSLDKNFTTYYGNSTNASIPLTDISENSNFFHNNDSRSTTTNNSWRVRDGNRNGEKKKDSFGGEFELSWFSGNSNRRYAFKEEGEANAKGNFNRHGRGEYDSMSTRSSRFKVKGSIDKYGKRTFLYSNLRRGGKRRSYSKRFSVDNFDINGDVYYKRKSMGLGSDSESAKHIKIKVTSDSDSDREISHETENSKSR
ncbi:uncharacterized protein DC041_0006679, partial [Schistosoma bovis]